MTNPKINAWQAYFSSLFVIAMLIFIGGCSGNAIKQYSGKEAAYAMPDVYSAREVAKVLREGGNAVDASVAAAFVLAVTFPEAGNIGGGGFMLARMGAENHFLDYRETAPLAAHRDMYLDDNGEVIDGASLIGAASAGVPGTVAGLWEAHQRFGTVPWPDLLKAAIGYAQNGFKVHPKKASKIAEQIEWFGDQVNFSEHFSAMGNGGVFKQPELAAALQRIAKQGSKGFYQGKTAEASLEPNSAQYVHLIAEMEKRVFADRAEYFGDPDFVNVPINRLVSDTYIARRASEVSLNSISALTAVNPGLESPNTTHFSITDQWGNAVANTYTLNWSYGGGVVVEGAGFLLNNQMDDFSTKPGVANVYGVVGGLANAIEPQKRMLSSMAPTLLLKNGEVQMVVGTPGGSTIFTSVFQAIVNVVDNGMTAQQAVSASRFHHQLLPADLITTSIIAPLPAKAQSELKARGYRVEPHGWEFGDIQLIDYRNGELDAASDPRGIGVSGVVE